MRTLALLSGGLDSCVALASCIEAGEKPTEALSVIYGQRHDREIRSAYQVAAHYGITHHIVTLSPEFSKAIAHATALMNKNEELPANRAIEDMAVDIPRSYVPGRNTIMLALAQSMAEAMNLDQICCGFNAVDYSGYPDCRPEFVEAWNNLAKIGTRRGAQGVPILLKAPIITKTKIDIAKMGIELRAPLQLTWSCYKGEELPCGTCDSCIIRWNAFKALGMNDPIGDYKVTPKLASEQTESATKAAKKNA